MELSEAKERLKAIKEEQEDMIITKELEDGVFYDDDVLADFEKDNEAIDTILKALENSISKDEVRRSLEEEESRMAIRTKKPYGNRTTIVLRKLLGE